MRSVLERQLDAARSGDDLYSRLFFQQGPSGIGLGREARVVRVVIRQTDDPRVVLRAAIRMAQRELLEGQHFAPRPPSEPVGRAAADPAATETDALVPRPVHRRSPPDNNSTRPYERWV